MRYEYEQVWSFRTARFTIVAEAAPEYEDPADSFEDQRDIDAIRNGEFAWFQARVRVLFDGMEIGADYLGGCAYDRPLDLFRHHATGVARLKALRGKTDRKSRLERKQWREVLANNRQIKPPVIYGEYGPDMVRQACREARKTLAKFGTIKMRDTEEG